MDPKTSTNFIPRSSAVDATLPPRAPAGIFTVTAVIIFICVVLGTGALFAYKYTLTNQSVALSADLETYKQNARGPDVGAVLELNNRLTTAGSRLGSHIAISNVFETLAQNTLQDVRWNNFNFALADEGGMTLTLGGQARSFSAVALQADRLSNNADHFRNILFSNMTLDGNGNPIFNVKMQLTPQAVSFILPSEKVQATSTEPVASSTMQ